MAHDESPVRKFNVVMLQFEDTLHMSGSDSVDPALSLGGALFVSGATGLIYKGSAGTHTILAAA